MKQAASKTRKQRFEIGQQVWPLMSYAGRHWVNPPFIVEVITRDRNEMKYGYTTEFQFYEINLFESHEAALTECTRRGAVKARVQS
jgi:hypothetical protein